MNKEQAGKKTTRTDDTVHPATGWMAGWMDDDTWMELSMTTCSRSDQFSLTERPLVVSVWWTSTVRCHSFRILNTELLTSQPFNSLWLWLKVKPSRQRTRRRKFTEFRFNADEEELSSSFCLYHPPSRKYRMVPRRLSALSADEGSEGEPAGSRDTVGDGSSCHITSRQTANQLFCLMMDESCSHKLLAPISGKVDQMKNVNQMAAWLKIVKSRYCVQQRDFRILGVHLFPGNNRTQNVLDIDISCRTQRNEELFQTTARWQLVQRGLIIPLKYHQF